MWPEIPCPEKSQKIFLSNAALCKRLEITSVFLHTGSFLQNYSIISLTYISPTAVNDRASTVVKNHPFQLARNLAR